jgi:hypothetical protein
MTTSHSEQLYSNLHAAHAELADLYLDLAAKAVPLYETLEHVQPLARIDEVVFPLSDDWQEIIGAFAQAGLVSTLADVAQVLRHGQAKYPESGGRTWQEQPSGLHKRHSMEHLGMVEQREDESGLHHSAHAATRMLMRHAVMHERFEE